MDAIIFLFCSVVHYETLHLQDSGGSNLVRLNSFFFSPEKEVSIDRLNTDGSTRIRGTLTDVLTGHRHSHYC